MKDENGKVLERVELLEKIKAMLPELSYKDLATLYVLAVLNAGE